MPMPDYESHHALFVQHFVTLHEAFGVEYARHAVKTYIETPGCPYQKIGHDVKAALDAKEVASGNTVHKAA